MKQQFLIVLTVVMFAVLLHKSSSALLNISGREEACHERILGNWIDVGDPKSRRIITAKGKVIDVYQDFGSDTMHYFFLNNHCDTICTVTDADTLVYHIRSVDNNYLDLNYLGIYRNKASWSTNIISYRKE